MDKYEYNLKLEEIDKLVDQGDYEEAANLADTIEWKRVRNVRTLCLISEIYEAAERLEDSKRILERAYRKSPVGKNVLYRLVEVTTALHQYDEALEYYTEYVQAAPHDNNRYILKYKLYRGRGSSVEELIAILEEYLGQEYTERWAYELALLYRQAGQIQKCLAACDDLVLWFHSGKYVQKALELKKKYTGLTPKQQQIYEECLHEAEEVKQEPEEPAAPEPEPQVAVGMDGDMMAEKIIAETEKEIAEEVTARKAVLEQQAPPVPEEEKAVTRKIVSENAAAAPEMVQKETAAKEAPAEKQAAAQTGISQEELQINLAKSMREIVAGVVKRTEIPEEDLPASVESRPRMTQKVEVPAAAQHTAGRLSIDDILLSMGENGKEIAAKVAEAEQKRTDAAEEEQQRAEDFAGEAEEPETTADTAEKESTEYKEDTEHTENTEEAQQTASGKTVSEAVVDELTDAQREALQYTNHPEKLLRNKHALPTYTEEDLGSTRRAPSKEELMEAAQKGLMAEASMQMEEETRSRNVAEPEADPEEAYIDEAEPDYPEEDYADEADYPEEEYADEVEADYPEEEYADEADYPEEEYADEADYPEEEYADEADYSEEGYAQEDEGYYDGQAYEDYMLIPEHLRHMFSGFTEIPELEDQIANAIIQAEAKGDDRTSKSGNILIFGAHGSGKTTMAMNLAKAIAQDRGSQTLKMAKIYASDLNKKDIAATVARIAGGTLIIEEAGDMDDNTVEQLTTAMEFRTDGLVVILEDEQKYVHELLMRHPRFTMKFTAQIYIPEYTIEELGMFGQIYANEQDYVIGDEGWEALYGRIAALTEEKTNAGEAVTIKDVIDMVAKAIDRSNHFFRKMQMGKKRYDENDYIILFARDFK